MPLDVPYLHASPWLLWRKRIVWLLALFLAEMYTCTVLRRYEDELAEVVALTFFIPLLIGTGGNSGTQITTTLVRAMAVGEVRLRNVLLVLKRLGLDPAVVSAPTITTVVDGTGPVIYLTMAHLFIGTLA